MEAENNNEKVKLEENSLFEKLPYKTHYENKHNVDLNQKEFDETKKHINDIIEKADDPNTLDLKDEQEIERGKRVSLYSANTPSGKKVFYNKYNSTGRKLPLIMDYENAKKDFEELNNNQ